jgi:CheY-like chemotaxis protein
MKRKTKLLVVEDDVLNQSIYKAFLSKDYEIKICSDDDDLYAALRENEYDIFIMDLALNFGKNGIELIKELRIKEEYKYTPIIVASAFAFSKDKEIAIAAGATKFITKPFNKETLLTEVERYFS